LRESRAAMWDIGSGARRPLAPKERRPSGLQRVSV
jgi:hypothetical protein